MDRGNVRDNYSVYCHIDPVGKMYFGISCDCIKRWNNGDGYKYNESFYDAIKKYGWDNLIHIIFMEGLTLSEANKQERFFIRCLHTMDPQYGYNLREGGGGSPSVISRKKMSKSRIGNSNCVGRIISDETKMKISDKLKSYYSLHTPTFLGRHHSPETIEKLKDRKLSSDTLQKMHKQHVSMRGSGNPSARAVRQLDLNGNLIQEFPYAKLAAEQLGIDLSYLIKCCRGKAKTCGGYRWEYAHAKEAA